MNARKVENAVVEEMPMEQSRSRQLMDPAAELEAVKRQQALFTEKAKLDQLKRQDNINRRWGLVGKLGIPAGAIILGTATLALILIIMNWLASNFWAMTNWGFAQ